MRLRLGALLLIAIGAGTAAGMVGDASAGKPRAAVVLSTPTALPKPTALPIARQPYSCPLPHALRDEFRAAATATALPLAMIVAVAKVESNLDVDARSSAGAEGLLQVLPATAAEFELDAHDVGENVLAGARYLRQLLDRFRSTELALAAYNAGPTAVEEEGARPNDETVAYVENVTAEWRRLVGCS